MSVVYDGGWFERLFECEQSRDSVGGQVDAGFRVGKIGARWQRIVEVEMEVGAIVPKYFRGTYWF